MPSFDSRYRLEVTLHIMRQDADERTRQTADRIHQRVQRALRHRSTQIASSKAADGRAPGPILGPPGPLDGTTRDTN